MLELERTGLPILPFLAEIAQTIATRGSLVLCAEPGAGKTSLVPPYLAFMAGLPGRILLLEPRRIAAVSAATRICELLCEPIGRRVGYRVRQETRTSREARIEAITEGVFIRMIQDDPGLEGVGTVIFDEFHERSLQADLGMALALEARALRPDLRILAMSATLDSEHVAAYLEAPVISVPGRRHEIQTRYAPIASGRGFEERLAALALALAHEAPGDLLVFLPGRAEIERCAQALAALDTATGAGRQGKKAIETRILHGSLSLEEQRRVLNPSPDAPKRIILATSIAETSLTVPRVRAVLDSGLARHQRFHIATGLNRLVTELEAEDRAEQRRGRAGRLGPGICVRAWPAAEALATRTEAQIYQADLSNLVLEAAVWGRGTRASLNWLDTPPEHAWNSARELLIALGALDKEGKATEKGRLMARLGTEPRLAALVLRGAVEGRLHEAATAAALLAERELGRDSDLSLAMERLSSGEAGFERVKSEAARLEACLLGLRVDERGKKPGIGTARVAERRGNSAAIGSLAAAAFPDRIGKRAEYRGKDASFILVSGRRLKASGPLAQTEWIVALEADSGSLGAEGRIFSGISIEEKEALRLLEASIEETEEFEWQGLGFRVRQLKKAGEIRLGERAVGNPPRERIARAVAERVKNEGLDFLPWGEGPGSARRLLARLRFWAGNAKQTGLPALDEEALIAGAGDWLGPFIEADSREVLSGEALRRAIAALLPFSLRAAFDKAVPEKIDLPSGISRPIEYQKSGDPILEARVQDFFGLREQPRAAGRPLILKLMSPAGRPIQVTQDLPGFWQGSWAEARKELRGRYPKHEWPENPALAAPSRSGLKKRS